MLVRHALTSLLLVCLLMAPLGAQTHYTGVNLSGAEFGHQNLPGTIHKHYTYPKPAEIDYFTSKGMNIFRLPFLWERIQPELNAPLDGDELGRVRAFVNQATSKGATVILDLHNFARYRGKVIGEGELPVAAFEDVWTRLAVAFKDHPAVIFGLMNEPHGMTTELWLADANAAIRAIRKTGATNLILVPGNAFSGAHSWAATWYGTPNATVMLGIEDPADNFAYEVHQYLDGNSSGTSAECAGPEIGVDRLQGFTQWLNAHGKRGFLGEFGAADTPVCAQAVDAMLTHLDENAEVWLGWTWWSAGPWWGDYMFSIEPRNGQDRPQMEILEKHIGH